jgi:hypothetical protein
MDKEGCLHALWFRRAASLVNVSDDIVTLRSSRGNSKVESLVVMVLFSRILVPLTPYETMTVLRRHRSCKSLNRQTVGQLVGILTC